MSGPHYLIYRELVRESIIKKKNGKFAWLSGLVPELISKNHHVKVPYKPNLVEEVI